MVPHQLGLVVVVESCTQEPDRSASPGQTAKPFCTYTSSLSYIVWYQQRPGQAPRYVHPNGYSRGEGIPDRFTASISGNSGYLTITNIQPEDEADYYCGLGLAALLGSTVIKSDGELRQNLSSFSAVS
uniref:Ig-like domain-containing protein n=1 Tax=Podarcis muralis TaxID=64176 RepID=A0A670JSB0_PODMU